ncbi:hypothetical protein BD408DRAFT_413049 [Parasitella parasitica]|nr:hypothetical protein BD408DRAFT_413049 [Parasitella parasitica]
MSVLSAFTEQKKTRPVYQFKRGNTFSSPKQNGIPSCQHRQQHQPTSSLVDILQSRISSSSSSSSSSSLNTAVEENKANSPPKSTTSNRASPDVDDTIFDFPDSLDEFAEIKVMVASTRAIPEAPKLTRKRSKPKKTNAKAVIQTSSKKKVPVNNIKKRPLLNAPIMPAPSINSNQQEAFDIFAFDPRPTSHLTFIHNNIPTTRPRSLTNSTIPINPVPCCRNNPTTYHPIPIASLLNETSFVETPPTAPVEKKRKRNLVAHLKTASGEKESRPLKQQFDCLSDEDDLVLEQQQKSPLMPLKDIIKDRSLSPELTYEETMQMQLDSLMKTEFGESSKPQQSQTQKEKRPEYKPLNKLNVRVTFQKK